jgi:hypothetical protein
MTVRALLKSVTSFVILAVLAMTSVQAQEPGAPPTRTRRSVPAAQRAIDPSRRVPRYFGQIGLTTQQRESIYKIQAKEFKKIEDL